MVGKSRILSVDHLQNEGILINLTDGTSIHLTLDQLLHLGVPRFRVATGEDGFEQAMRKAFKDAKPQT